MESNKMDKRNENGARKEVIEEAYG